MQMMWQMLVRPENWYLSAMAPHHLGTVQGEVVEYLGQLQLTYSTIKKPMREAFAEEQLFLKGLSAQLVLQRNMNTASYEWLRHLLEIYPEHVVEFSCFSRCWGTVPRHNTVFWEIRKY